MLMAKSKSNECGSIRPTIGGYDTQQTEAVERSTSSKLGASDFVNSKAGQPPQRRTTETVLPIKNVSSKYDFFEKEAATIHYQKIIISPCPFCLKSQIMDGGKRYNKKYGRKRGIQRFRCLNCKKYWSESPYFRKKVPDYIIDEFINISEEFKFASLDEIRNVLELRVHYKPSKSTVSVWRKQYRKGKLYRYRIPESRLNKISKPRTEYIPKIVEYTHYGKMVQRNYSNGIIVQTRLRVGEGTHN